MLDTKSFGEELKRLDFSFYTGVPCSYLKDLIHYAINNCEYIAAANEGHAVAIASGANIGGRKAVVLMQNSGLANAVSPLTSLVYTFKIPILGFVSLRGEPGTIDEPQHELMGSITPQMLSLMNIKWEYLSPDFLEAKVQLQRANESITKDEPFFFIVRKNIFTKEPLISQEPITNKNKFSFVKNGVNSLPSRYEALNAINSLKDDKTVQIATTGKTGRELYEIEDSKNNLYMVGSMGCAASLALGLALVKENKDIIAIDGDGALLMHMGSLAVIGYYNPKNLLHILLDNESYDSTGGQNSTSPNVDFVKIAASCGYVNSIYAHNLQALKTCIKLWKIKKCLTFIYLKVLKGSEDNLGRPALKPYEVKERLKVFING